MHWRQRGGDCWLKQQIRRHSCLAAYLEKTRLPCYERDHQEVPPRGSSTTWSGMNLLVHLNPHPESCPRYIFFCSSLRLTSKLEWCLLELFEIQFHKNFNLQRGTLMVWYHWFACTAVLSDYRAITLRAGHLDSLLERQLTSDRRQLAKAELPHYSAD